MTAFAGTPSGPAELWAAYRRRPDAGIRECLVKHYIGLVHHVAAEMARRIPRADADDLASAGGLGLMRAIERFDADRGLAFSTYAVRCIRGAILDDLRASDWMSRGLRSRARRIEAARRRVAARLHRAPRAGEVAGELGIDMDRYWEWSDEIRAVPREAPPQWNDSGAFPPLDTNPGLAIEPAGEQELVAAEERREVRQALEELSPRHQQVLGLLYFEEITARDVAGMLGVTESRVSQLRKQALKQLRVRLRGRRMGSEL